MQMRIRLYDVNGETLEDQEVELSERTKNVLFNHANAQACPSVTVEFVWDPEMLGQLQIPPGTWRGRTP